MISIFTSKEQELYEKLVAGINNAVAYNPDLMQHLIDMLDSLIDEFIKEIL